jgi:polyphenol oxidase
MSEMIELYPGINRLELGAAFEGVEVYLTSSICVRDGAQPEVFNLGLNVGDVAETVLSRRDWLENTLGVPVQWLNQVHGCEVLNACASTVKALPDLDASVTTSGDIALAVLTADCLPVVFYASGKQPAIGVAHAGWKGLAAGVLEATAYKVAELAQVPCPAVVAWMGPAIGSASFEVGPDVHQVFVKKNPEAEQAFTSSIHQGRYLCNLYRLAQICLAQLNIQACGGGYDTFIDSHWFSHRGSQKDEHRPVGRFATLARLAAWP